MPGRGQNITGRTRPWRDVLAQQEAALADEIAAEKKSHSSYVSLFQGHRTAIAAGTYLYTFDVQDDLSIVAGSPVGIKVPNETDWVNGTVLACENLTVDLSLPEDIGQNVPEAKLNTSPWQLLEKLNDRLASVTPQNRLALELIHGNSLATRRDIHEVPRGQGAAIRTALHNDITVIWGPPGTGKTYTMASIALEFMQRGKTVLAVSHSNVSVDGMALQVERHMLERGRGQELSRGRVLRYGEVRDKELAKNPNIVSYNYTLKKHPDLQSRIRELENLKRRIKDSPNRDMAKFKAAQDEITRIRKQLKAEEDSYVAHAHFVATTASKLYANKLFEGLSFDVVMFDEVSMAYVAQVIAAASYARSHLVCVGDFRQLSPIVQLDDGSENESLLTHDIFNYLGITDDSENVAVHHAYAHPWLVMLDEQRRMHPEISAFSNRLVYGGMLRDHPSVLASRKSVADSAPFPGHAVTLVDLTGVFCPASAVKKKSRYNLVSALVSIGLAIDAVTKGGMKSVAVVTPYRSQVKLLRKVLAAASGKDTRLARITCSTVHQFQGSERDLVIIDCVESHTYSQLTRLTSSNDNNSVNRLVNVAVTRAKGKLIVVANAGYWEDVASPRSNAFVQLIRYAAERGNVCSLANGNLDRLLLELRLGPRFRVYGNLDRAQSAFVNDIGAAKKSLAISIADAELDGGRARAALMAITKARSRRIGFACKARNRDELPAAWQSLAENLSESTPVTVIDDEVAWFGMPASANVVERGGRLYRPELQIALRIEDVAIAKSLARLTYNDKVDAGRSGTRGRASKSTSKSPTTSAAASRTGASSRTGSSARTSASARSNASTRASSTTRTSSNTRTNSVKSGLRSDELLGLLKSRKLEYTDNRPRGNLWVRGGQELKPLMDQLEKGGIKFSYRPSGGKYVYKGKPAWWTTWSGC